MFSYLYVSFFFLFFPCVLCFIFAYSIAKMAMMCDCCVLYFESKNLLLFQGSDYFLKIRRCFFIGYFAFFYTRTWKCCPGLIFTQKVQCFWFDSSIANGRKRPRRKIDLLLYSPSDRSSQSKDHLNRTSPEFWTLWYNRKLSKNILFHE